MIELCLRIGINNRIEHESCIGVCEDPLCYDKEGKFIGYR